jgi:uncharacterized protein
VVKTTVYLPESLKAQVERVARDRRTSEAEVIRTAIELYTTTGARPRPRLPPLLQRASDRGLGRGDARIRRGLILLDASGLFSAIDDSQPAHGSCRGVLERETGSLLLSPFVLAELDYLVTSRGGISAELALLDEITRGTYEMIAFSGDDLAQARAVIDRYRDLGVGLADASIVVLAGRLARTES